MTQNQETPLKLKNWVAIAIVALLLLAVVLARPLLVASGVPATTVVGGNQDAENAGGVEGIDVSHDQGEVNWNQVVNSGIQFVYHKATDGITWQDPMFYKNIQQLSDLKVDIGAYHFFEAEDDPQKQALNFLNTIKGQPLTLAPMVDVETTKSQTSGQIQHRLKAWLEIVQQVTGCTAIIYSYKDFWQDNIGPDFNEYPFWLADYSATMDAPDGVENLIIWQYSETGQVPGIMGNVDRDRLLSGKSEMTALRCTYEGQKDD